MKVLVLSPFIIKSDRRAHKKKFDATSPEQFETEQNDVSPQHIAEPTLHFHQQLEEDTLYESESNEELQFL
jgi:hypothetical protein